jgi:hypothetical protein
MSKNHDSKEATRQKAIIRKKKDTTIVAMVNALTDNFPMNKLTTMPVEKKGVSNISFGGHRLNINCNNPLGGKVSYNHLS